MKSMKMGIREGTVSVTVFFGVLFALTAIDPRVHDRVSELFGSGNATPFGDRLGDLGGILWSALRYQSMENAPLLVFATVGAVLTVFMLKS